MKLFLVRHGKMKGDPYCRPERPVEGCLDDLGVQQAQATGKALQDIKIDLVFSSPYGRALQTAELAMAGRDVPIKILDFLHEWMPDLSLKDLPSTEYEAICKSTDTLYAEETWKTNLGEGCFEMYARVCPPFLTALDEIGIHSRMGGFILDDEAKDMNIAVFAHGGSLCTLLSFLLGMRPFPVGGFGFEYTGVAELNFSERQGISYPVLKITNWHEFPG